MSDNSEESNIKSIKSIIMDKETLVREFEFQHEILDILLKSEEKTIPQKEYNELIQKYADIPMESMLILIGEVEGSIMRSKNERRD